ncbi:MAG: hypothetical protein IT546_13370, partial [Caulobacteraceae bacterium]|nr:hypothetical protein [Caulobacteraceae bacterium]
VALWTRLVEALEARDGRKVAAAAEAMVAASEQEVMRLMRERRAKLNPSG